MKMMKLTPAVVLEFNELTPALMQRFMAEGKLPNFSRLHDESLVFTTTAEERPPNLDPWIQWVTIHTGLNYRDHGVRRLNEGHSLSAPRVWDLVSDAGGRVWVCGSMSVGSRRPRDGALLPDPWTTAVVPHPSALEPYFSFIQRQVMDHTSSQNQFGGLAALRFLSFMVTHGLSASTAFALITQLAEERRKPTRWKRAALLDRIQFDVFSWYYRRIRPHLATLFLNSTAHFQHLYWREMDPDAFVAKPAEAHRRRYHDAIEYGYRQMDALVGRTLDMVDPSTTVVLATALSQQPCLMFEEHGGKFFYRPADVSRLTRFAGVDAPCTVSPVMAHQFHLYFKTSQEADVAAAGLARIRYSDRQALSVELNGCGVFVGCRVYEPLPTDARLTIEGSNQSAAFFEVFYQVDGVKSGMHHPDGMLWIRTPDRRHANQAEHVPLDAVAPTLLDLVGVDRLPFMTQSLLTPAIEHPIAV